MKTLDKEFLMRQNFSVLRLVFCPHSKISFYIHHTNFLKKQRSLCGIFLQGFALFLLCQKVSHAHF